SDLRVRSRRGRRLSEREVLHGDQPTLTEDRGALEDVAQLADVAGPVILDEQFARLARDPTGRTTDAAADVGEERLGGRQDALATPGQRRESDREHIEAIVETLAELPVGDRLR